MYEPDACASHNEVCVKYVDAYLRERESEGRLEILEVYAWYITTAHWCYLRILPFDYNVMA